MNKFNLIKENNQIKLIKYFYSKDTRGNFSKIFSEDFFYKIGFKKKIAQINISTNLIMLMIMRVYARPCKWVAPPHRALRVEGAGHAQNAAPPYPKSC